MRLCDEDVTSCIATVAPPSALILVLFLRICLLCTSSATAHREPVSTLKLVSSLLLALSCAAAALLLEPWLWYGRAPNPNFSLDGTVSAVGWLFVWSVAPFVTAAERSRAPCIAFHFAALLARASFIGIAVSSPIARVHLWPWLLIEAGLLLFTLVVASSSVPQRRSVVASEGVQPLSVNISATDQRLSQREEERHAWAAEQRELERVVPRGERSCCSVIDRLGRLTGTCQLVDCPVGRSVGRLFGRSFSELVILSSVSPSVRSFVRAFVRSRAWAGGSLG